MCCRWPFQDPAHPFCLGGVLLVRVNPDVSWGTWSFPMRCLHACAQVVLDAGVMRQLAPRDLDACHAQLVHMGEHVVKGMATSQALYQASRAAAPHRTAAPVHAIRWQLEWLDGVEWVCHCSARMQWGPAASEEPGGQCKRALLSRAGQAK